MGLTQNGLAIAGTPDTPDPSEQEVPVETSADYLKPTNSSSAHRASSPQATLSLPAPSVAQPEFTPQRPSTSAVVTSPPSASSPMFSPVPPPPPAAITVTVPATPTAPTMAESLLKPAIASTPGEVVETEVPAAASTPEPVPAEAPATVVPEAVVPEAIAADESVPAGYNSVFVDPTDYSLGATQAPAARPGGSPNVVFAERSSGCQITVAAGQSSPSAACGASSASASAAQGARAASASQGQGEIRVGPIAVSSQGVRLGSTTIVSREALNEKLRPLNVLRRGNEEYVFPLSVPASISSLFGWRMHPVAQSWRFHSGTDLAAPMGTPVLATRAGRVSVSDFLGGYGLTVIMRHDDDKLESRYAHLSQLAVEAGEWVEQGEVVGLVGSTGTSTGPHLHFELRQLTGEGWVAVDPVEVLEYGVANLLEIIDNPMLALGQGAAKAAETEAGLPTEYPFRPAQPNAS
ncbi:peptidoglycan DD-metalloendopeptidase family protein [Leptolyngbya subtilissima DQ-A4]|uniref:Peptidoglycan DD-metalloendopeptidase family protein n=2 Tax=Leptolyngbya TaxID=47251 RepID=A0ABV0KCH6_9CYAN|nr:M23 family metallopeptidase [Nodosilinea sp. FACHB-141]